LLLQRAAVLRQDAQIVGLQPDRRLMQVDDFDAGHRAQNLFRGYIFFGNAFCAKTAQAGLLNAREHRSRVAPTTLNG